MGFEAGFIPVDRAGNGGISLQIVSRYGGSSVLRAWERLKAKNEERRDGELSGGEGHNFLILGHNFFILG